MLFDPASFGIGAVSSLLTAAGVFLYQAHKQDGTLWILAGYVFVGVVGFSLGWLGAA